MVAKRARPKKALQKMQKMADEISAMAVRLKTNWNRYSGEDIKKGAKDSRKDALALKKLAAEFRRGFRDFEL